MQRWITANVTGRQQGDWDTKWGMCGAGLSALGHFCLCVMLDDIGKCDISNGYL